MNWQQLRKLILRGPDPQKDPYRLDFAHIAPTGRYDQQYVAWQRSRGGDAFALSVPYPFNNPIGAGIVPREQASLYGPPPAAFVQGAVFFRYPTAGQAIPEVVQPGGPLYDPATLAALIAQPSQAYGTAPTTPAIGAAQAGATRMNMNF